MANFEQEKLDLQARVINYATGIQDGSINACVKTKWGVKRFFKQARALGSDLGLTITGRAKLVVPKGKEEPKELTPEEKLFGKALGG